MSAEHRCGFITFLGRPNAGKSTLTNALLGEKLTIVSPRAQTTRHCILGILNAPEYQMILQDTPGFIDPGYELHRRMMRSLRSSLTDTDVVVLLLAMDEKRDEAPMVELARHTGAPVVLAVNKIDLATPDEVGERIEAVRAQLPLAEAVGLSALKGVNVEGLKQILISLMPEQHPFFDKEQISDRPERFFVAELIREKIFLFLKKEIPYSTEVQVMLYEERENGLTYIDAEIHVERGSQKIILIGEKGAMLTKIGKAARQDIETFLSGPVYLKLYVRVTEKWKDKPLHLHQFGYRDK